MWCFLIRCGGDGGGGVSLIAHSRVCLVMYSDDGDGCGGTVLATEQLFFSNKC